MAASILHSVSPWVVLSFPFLSVYRLGRASFFCLTACKLTFPAAYPLNQTLPSIKYSLEPAFRGISLSTSSMASRPQNIGIKAIEIYFPSQVHLEVPFRDILNPYCHHGGLD